MNFEPKSEAGNKFKYLNNLSFGTLLYIANNNKTNQSKRSQIVYCNSTITNW